MYHTPKHTRTQDASTPDGWWYDGGGLARSVRLVAANPLHIAPWGVYLPSAVAEGSTRAAHLGHEEGEDEEARKYDLAADAVMNAQVTVTNDGAAPATFTVQVVVTGPALGVGRAEATARSPAPVTLAAGATETFALPVALPGVALWSPRRPHLLQAAVQLLDATTAAGALLDEVKEMTGVRTLRFDAAQGFFLNGVPTKIQGMCNHQVRATGAVLLCAHDRTCTSNCCRASTRETGLCRDGHRGAALPAGLPGLAHGRDGRQRLADGAQPAGARAAGRD